MKVEKSNGNLIYGCKISKVYILIFFTIEYVIAFYKTTFTTYGLLLLLVYIALTALFTCSGHGRNVFLKYEQQLSIILKDIVTSFLMFIIMLCIYSASVDTIGSFFRAYHFSIIFYLLLKLLLLTACQIATFIVADLLAARLSKTNAVYRRVYICADKKIDISDVPGAELVMLYESGLDRCRKIIANASEIYLYDLPAVQRNDMLKECFKYNKPVFFTSKISDMELRTAKVAQDGDVALFYRSAHGISGKNAMLKRAFDAFFAFLFICILSPLFAVLAIRIKAEDGGPVFYKQKRCTKGLQEFDIIKFRSMRHGDEVDFGLTKLNDDRITKVGHFMRKYKLDELPQLINILKGDMSFVGPRPERPELIKECIEQIPEYPFRNTMKAGLTGYAQVHGNYHISFLEKLKWDLMYIENYSLMLDLKIILMTIPIVLKGENV